MLAHLIIHGNVSCKHLRPYSLYVTATKRFCLYLYFSIVCICIYPVIAFVFANGPYLYFSIDRICNSPLLVFVFAQVERGSQALRRCRSRQQGPGWSQNCAAIILDPMMILFCICICNEIQNSKTATNGLGITLSLFLIQ